MFQDRSEDDFVIVQDVDITQDDWILWRNSLAQMFIAMREESRFAKTCAKLRLGCVKALFYAVLLLVWCPLHTLYRVCQSLLKLVPCRSGAIERWTEFCAALEDESHAK